MKEFTTTSTTLGPNYHLKPQGNVIVCVCLRMQLLFYNSGCRHPLRHALRSRVSVLRNRRLEVRILWGVLALFSDLLGLYQIVFSPVFFEVRVFLRANLSRFDTICRPLCVHWPGTCGVSYLVTILSRSTQPTAAGTALPRKYWWLSSDLKPFADPGWAPNGPLLFWIPK